MAQVKGLALPANAIVARGIGRFGQVHRSYRQLWARDMNQYKFGDERALSPRVRQTLVNIFLKALY